jgi:hypothetical protein
VPIKKITPKNVDAYVKGKALLLSVPPWSSPAPAIKDAENALSAEDLLAGEVETSATPLPVQSGHFDVELPLGEGEQIASITKKGMAALVAQMMGEKDAMESGSPDLSAKLAEAVSLGVKEALKAILPMFAKPPALVELAAKQGSATITVKHADGTTSTTEQVVGAPTLFTGPPCNVGVASKLTIPLAPYTNAQVSVSLNVPCAHGEIDHVYNFAKGWVDARMTKLQAEVNAAKGLSS